MKKIRFISGMVLAVLLIAGLVLAADQRIQSSEEMVGAGHATKADTLNRHGMVEHGTDGVHSAAAKATLLALGLGDVKYADARFTLVAATRAMDAATGDVAYTGAGFAPKAIIAIGAVDGSGTGLSVGAASSITAEGQAGISGGAGTAGANLIYVFESAGKSQTGNLKSLDADGCTITWTRTGATAAATFTFYLLFLR